MAIVKASARFAPSSAARAGSLRIGRRGLLMGASALLVAGCRKPRDLVVFHAASLRRVFADVAAELEAANPGLRVHLESSGSQVAIRKVTEQGLRADVLAVADAQLIDRMMIPGSAAWNLVFTTNELVLAHMAHSRFTEEVDARNWPEILLREGVRLGRVNPDNAPLGYHTLFLWQLAQRSGAFGPASGDLAARLMRAVPKERIASDESELLSQLEAKAIDYAFLYRSTAEDHHLKSVSLPAELNLSAPGLEAKYAGAEVEVQMKQGAGRAVLHGHAITYGLTIPLNASNRPDAEKFVALLLGERGVALGRKAGFHPLSPALSAQVASLPPDLRALAAP